nr:SusC/RagA family TonB-linked outer membrane protein [Prevotella sp.]
MKKYRYILLVLFLGITMGALAQQITNVKGCVSDNIDVLMGASVCEIDGSKRIINATVTDLNGNFTMKIKNPNNKLRVSYVGCKTQTLPIKSEAYKVILESSTIISEVTITSKKRSNTGGLAIPERELSSASQSISTKEFEGLGFTSVDEALQGRIAGLDIVGNSGNLGSGTTMRLRGTSSLSTLTSSDPLIVVNGNERDVDMSTFDMSSANDEQFSQLLNINVEDIEDITVLKDATATAIYGSKGANGVIVIKTKRGQRGKPSVTYSLKMTANYQPKGYKMLSGDDYTMLLKESYFNPSQSNAASNIKELNYDPTFSEYQQYNNNTDWVDAVTQWGLRQNHYVSITGGGEKATFRISGGFDNETGSVIKQKLQRLSTNVALDYFVSDRITIRTNFAMTYTNNHKNYDNLLSLAYKKMPNMAIYEEDPNTGESTGKYYEMLQSASSVFDDNQKSYVNPVASANLAKNNEKTYEIVPDFTLHYQLLGTTDEQWRLDWDAHAHMNINNIYSDKFYPSELTTVAWSNGVNTSSSYSKKSVSFTTRQTLTLTPYFKNKDHSLMSMLRMEYTSGSSNWQNTDGKGLPSGGIEVPSAGGLITGMGSGFSQWKSLYYTFSTHYAYKGRYMFDFSLRADGTTKFGPNERWGYFPAVSCRWNIVDEPFMKPLHNWLSMLSIRPAWGKVGNQPSADYLYENKYGTATKYLDMDAMAPLNIRLTDLRWETKTSFNIGTDLGFWNDRLMMTIDLYSSKTKDMLMSNVRIPSNSGFTSLAYKNVGAMKNTGWEFNVNTNKLIRAGKFSMDINASFGNNKNEITDMDESVLESLNSTFTQENRNLLQRVQLNNPFGAIYGFRYKGVYQYNYDTFANMDADEQAAFIAAGKTAPIAKNAEGNVIYNNGDPVKMMYTYSNAGTGKNYEFKGGDAIYEDINHDGNINELDIVYLGSSLPKLTGGFGFIFNYGPWKLNTQFTYRVGNKILNLARLDAESMVSNNNQSEAVNYRWRKEGDVTTIPRAMYGSSSNYNTLISDRFVENGSFLRLNYTQITYRVPKRVIATFGLRDLNLYASANNLFILTKYTGVDPEVSYGGYGVSTDSGQTPRSRSFTFGLTVGF